MRRHRAWHRFCAHRAALASFIVLLILSVVCVGTVPWSHGAMRRQQLDAAQQPPSWREPLGTDEVGRSVLWRTLYGGALSLSLGLLAAAVAVGIGTVYGSVAGFIGGQCDDVMMRIVDVIYALPSILLVMLLTVSVGDSLQQAQLLGAEWARFVVLALAIGGVSWLTLARVVRGQVLSLREQQYIDAARALGLKAPRIIFRHLVPNLIGPVTVFATLAVPQAILQESFLSFLGIGVQPPQATWGSLAADGVRLLNPIEFPWWLLVFPCAALSLTLLALNFVGDGLRDAFDVRGESYGK